MLTEAARVYKAATGRTASTDELGELHACELLGLMHAPSPGYDAIDAEGLLVQVKARSPQSRPHVDPAGRMSRFVNWGFHYGLLVLFDGDFLPEEIVRRERDDIQALQNKIPNTNQGLHVSTFTRGGRVVWKRT